MGASFPVLDCFVKAQVKGCVLPLASQLHRQGMVWQEAHTQAVDWKGAERGNNSDLSMTEGSNFPSSSAQVKPALDTFPCLVLMLRVPWLLPAFFLCSSSSSEGTQVASFPLSSASGFRLCLREEGPAGEWLLRRQRPQHKAVLL
jgi:hypothetical protein